MKKLKVKLKFWFYLIMNLFIRTRILKKTLKSYISSVQCLVLLVAAGLQNLNLYHLTELLVMEKQVAAGLQNLNLYQLKGYAAAGAVLRLDYKI